MNKKTRTILFLICFLFFVLITPLAVLYSQGYRVDFSPSEGLIKISQSGGLFLKIVPRQADVYIDGKLNKKTDFFFGSILIENLLPKKHKIEVKKEGYHSWQKTLEIKKINVVEAKNIILFPKEINFNILSSETKNIWLSPDQKKIVSLEVENPSSLSDENSIKEKTEINWTLKLYDLEKNIKSHLIQKTDISNQEIELINLDFSQDSKKIYLEIGINNALNKEEEKQIKKFVLEIDKEKPILFEEETPLLLIENIENIVCYKIVNDDVYYLNVSGHLFKSKIVSHSSPSSSRELDSINEEKITEKAFPIKEGAEYSLKIFQEFIFLQESEETWSLLSSRSARENQNVYKFNFSLNNFEIFFEKVISLKISPDKKKLAYFSNHEIWILFLRDDQDPLERKAGQKNLLIRLSEPIKDVSWINDNYLIFIANEKVKISEIDDRDNINIIDILEAKKLPQNGSLIKTFFSLFDKKAYLLNEEGFLYYSDVLLP